MGYWPVVNVRFDFGEKPRSGLSQVLVRINRRDILDIDKAAKQIGINRSEFLRLVSIRTARHIIAEGIKTDAEQG